MQNSNISVWAALVLAIGVIIAAWIGANSFYRVHTLNNTLSVTGSASQNVQANTAKWNVSLSRIVSSEQIATAQTRVANDTQQVVNFFTKGGIAAENIKVSPIFDDQMYNQNGPTTFNVHEDITVNSDDPALIEKLSKSISSLAAQGVIVSAGAPEYYVSNLPQIRVQLIGAAVVDAAARANEIASSTKRSVGDLQSASTGVVQVLAPNSQNDVSDYGSYDTSTIDKVVMVTTHAVFYIK